MNKFLLFLFLFSGCSYFIKKLDSPLVDSEVYKDAIPQTPSYCSLEDKATFQLVGTSTYSLDAYETLVRAPLLDSLDFLDHFALWTLAQLSIRPDQSSPTSRLQVLILNKDKTHYFDFFSESSQSQYPYLYGIQWILKKFGKETKLETYAKILQKHLNQGLKVDVNLESFLLGNQKPIKDNQVLSGYFIRGKEVLKENESVPFLDYEKIIKHFRIAEENQKIIVNNSLSEFEVNGVKGNCNYDFNLYENSIFLIDKVIPSANIFGLSQFKQSFLASSSQQIKKLQPISNLPLFKGESKIRSSAVCSIKNGKDNIWAFSTASRDPGQHLFHALKYGLTNAKSTFEVDKLLRHSRHLFLSDPVRLIIESNRSNPDQIQNLLKLNLPIYNADSLGNIWAYARFGKKNRFIIDDRNSGGFLCK